MFCWCCCCCCRWFFFRALIKHWITVGMRARAHSHTDTHTRTMHWTQRVHFFASLKRNLSHVNVRNSDSSIYVYGVLHSQYKRETPDLYAVPRLHIRWWYSLSSGRKKQHKKPKKWKINCNVSTAEKSEEENVRLNGEKIKCSLEFAQRRVVFAVLMFAYVWCGFFNVFCVIFFSSVVVAEK